MDGYFLESHLKNAGTPMSLLGKEKSVAHQHRARFSIREHQIPIKAHYERGARISMVNRALLYKVCNTYLISAYKATV